jgi:flagellar biosynthetic protein FlhB
MPEQNGEKKHEASESRRQRAHEQGQVARSQDLASATLLLVAVGLLSVSGNQFSEYFTRSFREKLSDQIPLTIDAGSAANQLIRDSYEIVRILVPAMGALFIAAVAVNIGQTGFLFLPEKLNIDLKRIDPFSGISRIVSLTSVMRLLFGIIKVAIVTVVAVFSLWNEREDIMGLTAVPFTEMSIYVVNTTLSTVFKIGLALFLLALADFMYQRWKLSQDLMMTDQDMREEMKSQSGDPQLVARRRVIQRQLALNRMSNVIPQADVVVTNPTELAIAIRYDMQTMAAPIVIAKGAGVLAQRIRRLALEHDITIVERKELAQVLYKDVEVNAAIPSEQYAAVAEILRYVYELKGIDPRQAA